ncbi:protein E4C [Proboscivirus elephantidbeta4]|uniref:Protein E4C n=1 Tax=Elephant endotheliotropic herpesvirus 4 TaxID=548914 RepID=A0A0S1TP19_9BETA|nr:protein E4C [Elephant endotheliotropic herpesvirus 4]ALM25933.1 protein E4C [Elephant endotheliotropic herpesvirus 4]
MPRFLLNLICGAFLLVTAAVVPSEGHVKHMIQKTSSSHSNCSIWYDYDSISAMMAHGNPDFFKDTITWEELYHFEKDALAELNGYPTVSRWTYSVSEIRATYSVFAALGKRTGTNRVSSKQQCYAYEVRGLPEDYVHDVILPELLKFKIAY